MAQSWGRKPAFRKLVERLAGRDPADVDAARQALIDRGTEIVPGLVDALDTDDDRLRARITRLLGLLGDPRATQAVAALLHDESTTVRRAAAGALARLEPRRAIAALVAYLRREPQPGLRRVAVRSLVMLVQTGHERAAGPLLAVIGDPDEADAVRETALDVLPWLADGTAGPGSARALLERLAADARSARVARKARRMLDDAAPPRIEEWALSRLFDDLASRRFAVWQRAVTLIARLGGRAAEPAVHAMLARPEQAEYARRVVLALRNLSPRQIARVAPLLDEIDAPVVLAALVDLAAATGSRALLARLPRVIARCAPRAAAQPAWADVHARAHRALAEAGSRLAAADLRRALADDGHPVGADLVIAAGCIGTRDEIPALLRAYLRTRGVVRLAVHDAVNEIAQRERIRRNDAVIARLPDRERAAALQILGPPRRNGRPQRRRGRLAGSLESP
ncbi:MAG: hypothetical protein Kow0062_20220 [Acidobacteriota bacterium]